MKRFLFIACLLILSSCQFTKQQKAEKLVKDYLKTHLNDPDSYENVSFGKLTINPYAYEDTIPAGIELKKKEDSLIRGNDSVAAKEIRAHLDSIDFIYPNPIVKAYILDHTYRAKNGFGGVITYNQRFVFNKTCDTIMFVNNND